MKSLLLIFLLIVFILLGVWVFFIAYDLIFPPPTKYDCSLSLPTPQPSCPTYVNQDGSLDTFTHNFFTTNKVSPITTSYPRTPQTNPLTYYYGHATSTFLDNDDDNLYSYPFILSNLYPLGGSPSISLLPYSFTDTAVESTHPFRQFSYQSPNINDPNFLNVTFNTLTTRFIKDSSIVNTFNLPILSTQLTSGNIALNLAQGVPYISLKTIVTGNVDLTFTCAATPETNTLSVNSQKAYKYYLIWNEIEKKHCGVILFDSTLSETVLFTGNTFNFTMNNVDAVIYILSLIHI